MLMYIILKYVTVYPNYMVHIGTLLFLYPIHTYEHSLD